MALPAHQAVFALDDLTFFSDFDSGNLARAEKVAQHSVPLN